MKGLESGGEEHAGGCELGEMVSGTEGMENNGSFLHGHCVPKSFNQSIFEKSSSRPNIAVKSSNPLFDIKSVNIPELSSMLPNPPAAGPPPGAPGAPPVPFTTLFGGAGG